MNGSEQAARHETLKAEIRRRLTGKVALVGMGNILRGDDGFGPTLIGLLKRQQINRAALFDCGTVPENYIFPILSSESDTIILIDAADMAASSGELRILETHQLSGGGLSTHAPSLRLFVDLLKTGRDTLTIFTVSVQPRTIEFGEPISAEVCQSLALLSTLFVELFA